VVWKKTRLSDPGAWRNGDILWDFLAVEQRAGVWRVGCRWRHGLDRGATRGGLGLLRSRFQELGLVNDADYGKCHG